MNESLREQLLILATTPIYVIIIGMEIILSNLQEKKLYSVKDTVNNFLLMLLNGGLDLLFRSVYVVVLVFVWNYRVAEISTPWMYWITLLLAEDFLFYWLHRLDHEIRLFWAVHVTHHSSEHMNLSVGFRSSVLQPLYRFIYFIPLAWFGFQPMDIIFMYSATQIWGILIHTEYVNKLGFLEHILVTPSHHRVHHASNALYLDKNMGMFLIIWDKMFGTFQEELPREQYQPIRYGLTKPLESENPVHIVSHEWIAIAKDVSQKGLTIKERMGYLFGPPGWSHDGSRKTSEQMREEEQREYKQSEIQ
ncbi:MAG: sterol desaturase family protein [Sphingobacteriales bacterium]|jgi:sterol desaturase/sphingolipid hydroxylase (fatty acid hydroxylase superfamily)